MKIEDMITDVLNDTPEFVEVSSIVDKSYPDGFVGVQGCFDDTSGLIELTLVSCYACDEEFHWDNPKALKFYQGELRKTFRHEMIHVKQMLRGESFDDIPNVCDSEEIYYSHALEIEAYGRGDMYVEVTENGYSETLALYISLFGAGSDEVKQLTSYCEEERNTFGN